LRLLSERGRGDLLETSLRLSTTCRMNERNTKLFTIASRGYPENGVGSEVGIGKGLIGTVARAGRALQLSAIDHSLRYARAVRDRAEAGGGADAVCREIPLPGLPSAAGQIAVPLLTRGRLIGVLAVESAEPLAFMSREDTLLTIVASHLGGVHRTTQPGYGRISTRRPRKTSVFARARRTTAEPQLLFLPPG
jgi:signal transduction protein with GAF and PtsI domain